MLFKPEEHQPSGTCNFSRIDNVELVFSSLPTLSLEVRRESAGVSPPFEPLDFVDVPLRTIRVYAINYNILRITSGMGGLAYSN